MAYMEFSQTVEAEGHLIDSQILSNVMDRVIKCGALFDVVDFRIGRNNDEFSRIRLCILAPSKEVLSKTLEELVELGCYQSQVEDAVLKPAPKDHVVPDDFYSTTNYRTSIYMNGEWISVKNQRMDAVIVVADKMAKCRKLRDVKMKDMIVCGSKGIRVQPSFKERDRFGFAFMSSDTSTERCTETAVCKVAEIMRQVKHEGGRIVFVAGPVVVHTGGGDALSKLIRSGYVDGLLAGNALAVHDIEQALFGTSLGIDIKRGIPVEEGHKNHMRSINVINNYGSIDNAVKAGILQTGIMFECINNSVPFVLAGSIRDDGPLPDTEMDLVKAQNEYASLLDGTSMVICLSSMLHSIGVGNMIPSWVRMVCVDINPSVVTKLSDRGSHHTIGIVTNVETFLTSLLQHL